jgi:hypothetical protein
MISEIELYEIICEKLTNKEPFSVIRCGDGEMFAMKSLDKNNVEDIENVPFLKHIGYIPEKKDKEIIIKNMETSINNCDILGITNNVGKKWTDTKNFFKELTNYNKVYVSADFHHVWVKDKIIIDLLKNTKELFYISGHDLDERFKKIGIKNVDKLIIPKQVKYFGNQIINHYPDEYFRIIDEISKKNLSGKLCLVGGGFIGKYYIDLIKKSGGVGVDIGSAFDLIAGFKTRGTRGRLINEDKYII